MGKMKREIKLKLSDRHTKYLSLVMIVLAAWMLGDGVYQIEKHVTWRRWMPETLIAASPTTQPTETQPAETQPASAGDKDAQTKAKKAPLIEVHAAIKKRNIFAPMPKPASHETKLTGLIGTTAVFQKKDKTFYVEEGKSAEGLTVKKIDGYQVTIEFQGKSETMQLFPGASFSAGSAPSEGASAPSGPRRERDAALEKAGSTPPPDGGPPTRERLERVRVRSMSRSATTQRSD
jgi:hypothetical protein